MEKSAGSGLPPVSGPETPRKKGELCPLEAMLRGIGEPESWLMDCSSPAAAWELPPPLEEDAGGELGLLEGQSPNALSQALEGVAWGPGRRV